MAGLGKIDALYRYPVKGLSAHPLDDVMLDVGQTVPFDRLYAVENGRGRFRPADPKHLPKANFVMLMRNRQMASLEASFDDRDHTLVLRNRAGVSAKGQLNTGLGRSLIEEFLAANITEGLRGRPRIVFADGHSFSDVKAKCLHIVNRASLEAFERASSKSINPIRFRPNAIISGFEAWQEFDWVGRRIRLGDAVLRVLERTVRCAATEVEPQTGARNIAVPALLQRLYGHFDFGIYAEVIEAGAVMSGGAVELLVD
ncbi:MAG: MOSC domain-containing protein [Pseudomonadota bacterium]